MAGISEMHNLQRQGTDLQMQINTSTAPFTGYSLKLISYYIFEYKQNVWSSFHLSLVKKQRENIEEKNWRKKVIATFYLMILTFSDFSSQNCKI